MTSERPPIDWEAEARAVGSYDGSSSQRGGRDVATAFLARHLGEEALREATRFYVLVGGPGSELARSVLIHLAPESSRDECVRLYDAGDDAVRSSAVELVRMFPDERTLPFFDRVLREGPPAAQHWAAYGVRQLQYGERLDAEAAADWVDRLLTHSEPGVRHQGGYLAAQVLVETEVAEARLRRWLPAVAELDETHEETLAEIRRRLG